jgi:glyoxylase-like metal-dependent hydrolase (beta-lactamase superfamily II)
MKIETLAVGAFQENTYLVIDETKGESVLIDPGAEPGRLIAAVEKSKAVLTAMWITHAHIDHVGAIAGVKRKWAVPIYLHPLDATLYRHAHTQAELYGLPFDDPPPPDGELADGDTLEVGALRFDVAHVPGHAPGHVMIYGNGVAFVGDCLFAGSVGRTDLPGSNGGHLSRSLEKITALDPATVLYPGHGPATTVGEELRSNPFLNGTARIVA